MTTTVLGARAGRRLAGGSAARVAFLAAATALTLGPVLWTVSTSLRPVTESLGANPSLLPTSLDFGSYADVFRQVDMGLLILNSVLVTAACAIGQMLTAAMAGYVFARVEFRGRTFLLSDPGREGSEFASETGLLLLVEV